MNVGEGLLIVGIGLFSTRIRIVLVAVGNTAVRVLDGKGDGVPVRDGLGDGVTVGRVVEVDKILETTGAAVIVGVGEFAAARNGRGVSVRIEAATAITSPVKRPAPMTTAHDLHPPPRVWVSSGLNSRVRGGKVTRGERFKL